MSIPKHFRLFGKRWTVKIKKIKEHGLCTHWHSKIHIHPKQSLEMAKETFLHEVTHAVDLEMGLHMKERQVTGLSTGLFGWIRDNPKIVKWIMGSSK